MTQPASNCMHCQRLGSVSTNQDATGASGQRLADTLITFHCTCGRSWRTPAIDAQQHGVFLDRAGLRR